MGRRGEQMTELGDEAPVVEASRAARARREQAEAALTGASEAIAIAEIRRETAAEARDSAESDGASARAALAALESEAKALARAVQSAGGNRAINHLRSEDHTSALQSLMRTSYAAFCLKKNIKNKRKHDNASDINSKT